MGRGSLCLFHVRHASAVFSAHSRPTTTADVAVATLNPECEESHLVTNGATELRGNGRDLERAACRLATVDTDSKCVETLTDPANSIAAPVNAILAVVEGVAQREAGVGDSGVLLSRTAAAAQACDGGAAVLIGGGRVMRAAGKNAGGVCGWP